MEQVLTNLHFANCFFRADSFGKRKHKQDMSQQYIHSVILLICLLNVLLHLTGMYLLISLRNSTMNGNQRLLLLNLSLSEFCLAFIEIVKRCIYITINSNESVITQYINIIQFSSAAMVFYFIMIYMTADRFFHIYLSIRYPLYWSKTKTMRLVWVTWIVCIILSVLLSFLHKYQLVDYKQLFYIYLWPITELLFLAIAFGTYGYAFKTVYRGRKNKSGLTRSKIKRKSIFRQPALYLPSLLIFTFVVLQVVPDLTIVFVTLRGKTLSEEAFNGVYITYMVSILLDAIIYILLSPYVKRMLIQKLVSINLMRPLRSGSSPTTQTLAATVYDK